MDQLTMDRSHYGWEVTLKVLGLVCRLIGRVIVGILVVLLAISLIWACGAGIAMLYSFFFGDHRRD